MLKEKINNVNMLLNSTISEVTEMPPKSFVVKEALEYFKPKIHVEMDNPEKQDTVTEIHMKGWKVDKPLIEVLGLCLPALDQLHSLKYKKFRIGKLLHNKLLICNYVKVYGM